MVWQEVTSTNPLHETSSDEQTALLAVVAGALAATYQWPVFDYVDRLLYKEFRYDARSIIQSIPRLSLDDPRMSYGWFFVDGAQQFYPQPEDRLGLTVAGMLKQTNMLPFAGLFLDVLKLMVNREARATALPLQPATATISADTIHELIRAAGRDRDFEYEPTVEFMKMQLRHEPATWNSVPDFENPDTPRALWHGLRNYRSVANAASYVDCLADVFPVSTAMTQANPSSLSLPEALHFLNTMWRLHCKAQLFVCDRIDSAAQLALDCSSKDELAARMSALAGILGKAHLPTTKDSGLNDLQQYLESHLPSDDHDGVIGAVGSLKAIVELRNSLQHTGSKFVGRDRWAEQQLNISLASGDWSGIWDTVRIACTDAVNTLRNEAENLKAAT